MDSSLFITGSSGFVGQQLMRQVDPKQYRSVTLLSRNKLALPKHLAEADNVRVVRASIHDRQTYAAELDADTKILHLAAVTGKAERETYFDVNVRGTELLVAAACRAKVSRFLFVSSIAVAFKDRPEYHYAESKQMAEQIVQASGLRYCIVRPTIILGKGAPVLHNFAQLIKGRFILLPGGGAVNIQPIYVGDLARLLLELLTGSECDSQTLPLGGPEVLTIAQLLKRIYYRRRRSTPTTVPIPLGLVIPLLRILEKKLPNVLPVSSGQFASFLNDGTATPTPFSEPRKAMMKDVDSMLEIIDEVHEQ